MKFCLLIVVASSQVPWCVTSDFNTIRRLDERRGGNLAWTLIDVELDLCCGRVELEDLRFMENLFT